MSTEPFLGTCARDTLWADDLVEEILAEGEALTEKSEKCSVQCADVFELLFRVVSKSFYTHSGSYS